MAGILVADCWPNCSVTVTTTIAVLSLVAWLTRHSLAVCALVAAGFFFVHSVRTTETAGLVTARFLGSEPRPVTVQGAVVTEPKVSERGSVSFLLEAQSIETDGEILPCRAKFLARWERAVQLGDEVRLFGTAQRIEGPRNPGEFDLRAYLARMYVNRAFIVRYP